jgi:ABC-type glycerol-3-phosphate transport system permease component
MAQADHGAWCSTPPNTGPPPGDPLPGAVLVAIIFIFPLLFMVMSSLKPDDQLLADTSSMRAFLPVGDISLDNYRDAFERAPVGSSC